MKNIVSSCGDAVGEFVCASAVLAHSTDVATVRALIATRHPKHLLCLRPIEAWPSLRCVYIERIAFNLFVNTE